MSERSVRKAKSPAITVRLFVGATLLASCVCAPAGAALAELPADPTRPPGIQRGPSADTPPSEATRLELQAVFHAEGRSAAIINGHRVGLEDTVQRARVVEIERDRVALRRDGQTIELELVPTVVKRRVSPTEFVATVPEAATAQPEPTANEPTTLREEAKAPVPAAPAIASEGIE